MSFTGTSWFSMGKKLCVPIDRPSSDGVDIVQLWFYRFQQAQSGAKGAECLRCSHSIWFAEAGDRQIVKRRATPHTRFSSTRLACGFRFRTRCIFGSCTTWAHASSDQTEELCYMPRIQKRFAMLRTWQLIRGLQQTENMQVGPKV